MELIIEEKNESNINNQTNENTNNIPLCTTEVYNGIKTNENKI